MAHEITQDDQVVLHKEGAWHGLGVKVEDAPTPREALKIIGADYGVERRALYTKEMTPEGEQEAVVPELVAIYRADKNIRLGTVSSKYQPVQNVDLADFCSALLDQGQVKCETAGTIRRGAMIWFLLKGAEFEVANGDGMFPYVMVSNGHDGGAAFRVTPTTVRVVCSNTMHMVIPRFDTGELGESAISIRHTVNVMERVEEAKKALAHYSERLEETKRLAAELAKKQLTADEVRQFFLDSYTVDFGPIPANPVKKVEQNQRDRALSAFASFSRRFDDERTIAGASAWNAFNAYSGLVQHDQKARGKDDSERVERRVDSNLFGLNQDRTQQALRRAFKMAVAV